jgi:beta-glucosidase
MRNRHRINSKTPLAHTFQWKSTRPKRGLPLSVAAATVLASGVFVSKNDSAAFERITPEPAWPATHWPLVPDQKHEHRIEALLARMSVEEKVAQTVQADIGSITPADMRKYRLGAILAGGNSDPGGRYNATPAEWLALADAYHAASIAPVADGVVIPSLFGIDAVHGNSNVVGATLFPHNIGLGATRNPALMREIGRITAIETRAVGMDWAFAPTVAVPQDDRWGRTYEGYSESPQLVAELAPAMVEGLQGIVGSGDFLGPSHVIASVKHFVGDGGTTDGKDQGDTRVSERELATIHGAGYPPTIAVGAQSVMASFNSVNGTKVHGDRALLTDVLKGRMNFGGFVVGDWNAHGQVNGCSNVRCPASFNAGVDMMMTPDSWKGYYESAVAAVKSGEIPIARLDDAVRRILRVKARLGLFDASRPSQRKHGGRFELLGAPQHRAIARQAVRESLVLLKNRHAVLPLDPRKRILVAGASADDIGMQSGGWTLNWQGTGTRREDYPNAETIYEGIHRHVTAAGGEAVLSVEGTYRQRPDAAIVVFGESPYAEFSGDLPNLLHKQGDAHDLQLIRRLKADGIPVVAVFLSGRPLWMNREINAADAFVAAWLPGSEGGGVADVLLRSPDGAIAHDFKGKLSFSWPRTAAQYRNNVGQSGYDPQFAFGYGLRYADNGDVPMLAEASGLDGSVAPSGVYMQRGKPVAGFNITLRDARGVDVDLRSVPASLPDDSLRITGVDYRAQEDARRLFWNGRGIARLTLSAERSFDLTRESNADILLILTMKLDAMPTQENAWIGIGCGRDCVGRQPLRDMFKDLPLGQWLRVGVPLKCFAEAGANLSNVDAPLILSSAGRLDLSIARIALGAADEPERTVLCRDRRQGHATDGFEPMHGSPELDSS